MHSANAILGLLCLFQIKHLLADYYFQTKVMLTGRENYVHAGRAMHAGVHALLSIVVLGVFGAPFWLILGLAVAEWVVHFHIDWWKASDTLKKGLTPADAGFWRGFGIDQALHQLTYVAMVWVWTLY